MLLKVLTFINKVLLYYQRGNMVKRRFLAAREDLVGGVSSIAKDRHLTLYGVVNEALQQVIRVEAMKRTLNEVVDEYMVVKTAKETGSIIVAEELLHPIVEKAYAREREPILKAWYEQGLWYGKIFPTQFPNQDPLRVLEKVMQTLIWGTSDLAVSRERDGPVLRCIGPRFSQAYTVLLATFLEGMIHAQGYQTMNKDVSRGVILITFSRK